MSSRYIARPSFIPGTEAPSRSIPSIEQTMRPIRRLVAADTDPLDVQRALDVITSLFCSSYDVLSIDEFHSLPNSKESEALWDATQRTIFIPINIYQDSLGTRARFTICHELSHMILGHKPPSFLSGRQTLHTRDMVPIIQDPEWQADKGASFLLMPIPGIQKLDPISEEEIMRRFITSRSAAKFQLKTFHKFFSRNLRNPNCAGFF